MHRSDVTRMRGCQYSSHKYISQTSWAVFMMTSSNGNIFRVTGHLCGEFTGPGEFPAQKPVTRSFDVFFDLEAGDLRHIPTHYDVIVMSM